MSNGINDKYRKGNSDIEFCGIWEKNMRSVYDSAKRKGDDVWDKSIDA